MPVRERILTMGVTGSGKSYQWMKIAEALLPRGVKFRCLDTDDAISYMLKTQFPHLVPQNGGNVYVHPAYDWPEYKEGLEWLLKEDKEDDWNVVDMIDNAWSTVQRYFIGEVFQEKIGDYFLMARKALWERGDMDRKGKPAKSVMPEAMRGWIDWPVVNKLYEDWILPIVYRTKGHLYAATKPRLLAQEDDPDTKLAFGALGLRPSGQKHLGHQVHTCFLLIPGKGEWKIATVKDRANRPYFKNTRLSSLFVQYLVAKAGWSME